MSAALVVYAVVAAIGFTAGAISWAIEPSINSRVQRDNARIALLSLAWPIALPLMVLRILPKLYRDATWKEDA